ncbi:hypothetical protein [Pseudophaeobacter sp. EL27]|uniref:hypothetical protein n=1 Tax=Pseudophaeobacter sp. EL27 TaxID=2107580 RepID=UPI000EFA8E9B|nr:hypothetical protein [Pseudophaeobacter sp. EL27]
MFWLGLSLVIGALLGLAGKARWFFALFAGVTLLFGGFGLYDYYVTVLPNMEMGGSDDGTRIGFAFATTFLSVAWLATLIAFCFGLLVNTFLRFMDWL